MHFCMLDPAMVLYRGFAKLDEPRRNWPRVIVCVASRTSALVHRRVQHDLMLLTELAVVRAAHVVLASASPRRVQILNEQLGINAVVMPSFFEENLEKSQYTTRVRAGERFAEGAGGL